MNASLRCLALAVVTSTFGSIGCVDINKTHLRTEENVISSRPMTVASPRFAADVELRQNVLRVLVTPQCSVVEEQEIERVDISDKTVSGDARAWMTALSVAGSLPLMGGTAMLADAPNVHDADLNARLYNEIGQPAVIGVGVLLVGIGLAAVMPPMVNGLRAVGTTETRTTSRRNGPVIQEKTSCAGLVTLPTYSVVARFTTGHAVPLGGAMPNDEFHVDLRTTLGPTILGMNPQPDKVAIWINEKFQTELSTESILSAARDERDKQDDAAWTAAEPSACEKSEAACAKVQQYLHRFPNGKHAEHAKKLLQPRTSVVAADPNKTKLNQAIEAAAKARLEATKKLDEEARKAFEKSQEKLKKDAKAACERECAKTCGGDKTCRDACIVQVCP